MDEIFPVLLYELFRLIRLPPWEGQDQSGVIESVLDSDVVASKPKKNCSIRNETFSKFSARPLKTPRGGTVYCTPGLAFPFSLN